MNFLEPRISGSVPKGVPLLVLTVLLASCAREKVKIPSTLPATPIFTIDTSFGVVQRAYERVFAEKNPFSELNGLLRMGDIVQVLSRESLEGEYWINIQNSDSSVTGWVPQGNLDIYDSLEQARTDQESIRAARQ